MKFAQSCDSRECKSNNKDQFIKNVCETITTVHDYDSASSIVKCMSCGKETKLSKV